jgi:hypothetical protein
VVLWFEHDVFDQLLLVRMLSRYSQFGAPTTLTMVSIDRHPNVAQFLGFGNLKPDDMAALWPQRTPIAKDAFDEATSAWIALTAADPRAISFVAKRSRALPYLTSALERWLEEFPDVSSGLSRTERQMLAAIARGATTITEFMSAAHAIDPRYPLTNNYAAYVQSELLTAGLIAGTAGAVTITASGRDALASNHDRIASTGIDRWHGGCHLLGHGPCWRWDTSERKLVWR